ncbi:MAG: hypothetical protein OEM82_14395 [Acidobacteriota bacterium]|nr:hypothetical protein [Acidobacteriota bacterium]
MSFSITQSMAGSIKILLFLFTIFTNACTSLNSYGPDQISPELPIKLGDEVKIYERNFGRIYKLVVTDLTEETIKGKLVLNPKIITTVRWEEIARLELRQPDSTKTTLATILGILLVIDLIDLAEHVGCAISLNQGEDC